MIPDIVKTCEKFLTNAAPYFESDFLVGDKLTIADFWIGGLYTNYLANDLNTYAKDEFANLLSKHPVFEAYGKRYAEANKAFLESRAQYPI